MSDIKINLLSYKVKNKNIEFIPLSNREYCHRDECDHHGVDHPRLQKKQQRNKINFISTLFRFDPTESNQRLLSRHNQHHNATAAMLVLIKQHSYF